MAQAALAILAVDGVDPSHQAVVSDLEEIASARFGSELSIVMAVDDGVLDAVTRTKSRREPLITDS
jgi:hypothetical protein